MNKTEFLELLRAQLDGLMPGNRIAGHLQYYRDYIEEQVRGGRREEEVLEELGDPRLIARTLLDVEEQEEDLLNSYEDGESDDGYEQEYVTGRRYRLNLSTWYGKALVIVVAVLAIIGLVVMLGVLIPVVAVTALVLFILSWLLRR